MLRHSYGYCLADIGTDLRTIHDYLGRRDPKHTVIYIRITGSRLNNLPKWNKDDLIIAFNAIKKELFGPS